MVPKTFARGCITRKNHPHCWLMGASLPHTQQFRACRVYCEKSLMHPLQIAKVQQNLDAPTPWTQAARHGMRKNEKRVPRMHAQKKLRLHFEENLFPHSSSWLSVGPEGRRPENGPMQRAIHFHWMTCCC